MTMVELIGYSAAFCSTASLAPQLIKSWRTRSTGDISLGMFLGLVTAILLWIVYGVLKQDGPVIVGNVVGLMLVGGILLLKVRYK